MTMICHLRALGCLALLLASFLSGSSFAQTVSSLPSETPAKLEPATESFDYVKRDEMIPMRDGVRLHTVIVIPKGAKNAPILLTRTPYNASSQVSHAQSSHLGPILNGYDNPLEVIVEGGYTALKGARHAGRQFVGSGRYLWRYGSLQSNQTEGHQQ
jgi:uncharacterized protein